MEKIVFIVSSKKLIPLQQKSLIKSECLVKDWIVVTVKVEKACLSTSGQYLLSYCFQYF